MPFKIEPHFHCDRMARSQSKSKNTDIMEAKRARALLNNSKYKMCLKETLLFADLHTPGMCIDK